MQSKILLRKLLPKAFRCLYLFDFLTSSLIIAVRISRERYFLYLQPCWHKNILPCCGKWSTGSKTRCC